MVAVNKIGVFFMFSSIFKKNVLSNFGMMIRKMYLFLWYQNLLTLKTNSKQIGAGTKFITKHTAIE